MNILFVVNALGSGGAEKIFMDMITNFDYKKHHITLLMVDYYGVYVNQLPKEIRQEYIFEHVKNPTWKRKWYGVISIVGRYFLRKKRADKFYNKYVKEKYDVEIAFLEGEATRLVAQSPNLNSVKYAWVHTDMIKNPWSEKCYPSVEDEKKCYEAYDRILAVSNSVKEAFEKKYRIEAQVMYNALDEQEVFRKADAFPCKKTKKLRFVTVGRLEKVKGFERLIQVFECIHKEHKNVELVIVGDGSERAALEKQIEESNLSDTVFLYGYQTNPYPYIKNSDVLICSSYAEGFSTVVTEALILGIPVVTTECAGMHELLGDSEYGLIVENSEQGLYEGVLAMLTHAELRNDYAKAAFERGKKFCVKDRIVEIEEQLEHDLRMKEQRRIK